MKELPLKCVLLERFVTSQAYERGHSAGQEEVDALANGLRYDLREVDELIARLEGEANELSWINNPDRMGQ